MKAVSRLFVAFALCCAAFLGASDAGARGKMVHAVFHAPPYMVFGDSGVSGASGIDVEIVLEIARRMDMEVEYVPCTWDNCLDLMRKGKADILSSAYRKPDREEYMSYFSSPYLDNLPIAFYFRRGENIRVDSYEDLHKLSSVGVLKGASYFPRFDSDKAINKIEVESQNQLFPLLAAGKFQAMAGYVPTEDFRLAGEGYASLIARSKYEYSEPAQVFMAVSRKSPLAGRFDEMNAVNDALVREGFIKAVVRKYYSRHDAGR